MPAITKEIGVIVAMVPNSQKKKSGWWILEILMFAP